jgi:hypothetical protein
MQITSGPTGGIHLSFVFPEQSSHPSVPGIDDENAISLLLLQFKCVSELGSSGIQRSWFRSHESCSSLGGKSGKRVSKLSPHTKFVKLMGSSGNLAN